MADWGRLGAWAVAVVTLGAVASPLREGAQDSFPLSNFPMFSNARPAEAEIEHVVAVAGERREAIPPGMVASGEVLQTKVAISQTVQRGRAACRKLCREVAARVADDDAFAWAEEVHVRADRYQVLGYFTSSRRPLRS